MEVVAAPRRTLAWVCPECGHGSTEPRDEQAHLDAHRQLRQFLKDWDAAAVADRATERRKRLRPVAYAVVALAVVLLGAVILRLSPGGDARPPAAGPAPAPALPVPPDGARPPAPVAPPGGGAEAAPAPAPSRPSPSTAAPPSAPVVPSMPSAPSAGGPAPPVAADTPAPGPPAPVAPGPSTTPAPPRLLIHGCVLMVCVALGP